MVVNAVPRAYAVIVCPAADWLTDKLVPISGSSPAGNVSVKLVTNTAVARAKSCNSGSLFERDSATGERVMPLCLNPLIYVRVNPNIL
jgi:hypothetical protein